MANEKLFYNRLFNRLLDIFFRIHADGRIIYISESAGKLTGFSPEEIKSLGTFWELLADPGDPAKIIDMLIINASVVDYELPLKTRDNSPLWVSLNAYYYKGKDSLTIEGTARDITKRKEAQQSLHNSEKLAAIGQLAAGIAHEINNPLTSASLSIQIIMEKIKKSPSPEAITRKLEGLQRNIDKAASITKKLLTMAKSGDSLFTRVNINDCINEALSKPRCAALEIRSMPGETAPVMGNPALLSQAVANILDNALEFTRTTKGIVTIATYNQNGSVTVEITDNGTGISDEDISRVFNPFFTTKGVGEGTGLGLSVSYGIIRQHGGEMVIHSTPGKGTTVIFSLPAGTAQ
ncbi:MAG: PAS domain S-box protein [Nitrospirae bacterium]|nr:PAS domain S-box protein [Nitrospirota bacterium]